MAQNSASQGPRRRAERYSFGMKFSLSLPIPARAVLGLILMVPGSSLAAVSATVKMDYFGYRTTDPKLAYFTSNPGATVEVHDAASTALVYTITGGAILSRGTDVNAGGGGWSEGISKDSVWSADFTAFTTPGTYYVLSPSLGAQSYTFQIQDGIYVLPMVASMKALYYNRCGTAKPPAYAGANWADASACHMQDAACTKASGCSGTYGTLDLTGGWHDAGDYNKYIGGDTCGAGWGGDGGTTLWYLLTAYEWNPGKFYDGQNNIPESGNGVPDILDEAKWELDWYLKMQRPDFHVLSVVHQTSWTGGSPPSTDVTTRYYYASNARAEAIFTACTAHAARVFAGVPGLTAYAATLKSAAVSTWTSWRTSWPGSDEKCWAAAEIYRLDNTLTAAMTVVNTYKGGSWSGVGFNENQFILNHAVDTYIQTAGANATVVNNMKNSWGNLVNDIFNNNDNYNSGMHNYDYFWSSNEVKMNYGMDLLWGVLLGAMGTHTAAQCQNHALDYLHYIHGANPKNMTYMTQTEGMGGHHSVWRIYHGWFGDYSRAACRTNFIGKPSPVVDPLYPYYTGPDNYGISDSVTSKYGQPPGFVPDGPTYQYYGNGGQAVPPNLAGILPAPDAKAYRDWNYSDPTGAATIPWVVNETGIYYCSAYTLLSSAFQGALATPTVTPTWTYTKTWTPTYTISPTRTATASTSFTPSFTESGTISATSTASASDSPTSSPSPTPTASASLTDSASPTSSPTPSATLTTTPTASPSFSPSPTMTPSASYSPSPTLSLSPSRTASPSSTGTATILPSRTPSPSPTPVPGELKILDAALVPNPVFDGTLGLYFKLGGPASLVRLKIFTDSGRKIRELDFRPPPSSYMNFENEPNLGAQDNLGRDLSNGTYHYVLEACDGDTVKDRRTGTFFVLR